LGPRVPIWGHINKGEEKFQHIDVWEGGSRGTLNRKHHTQKRREHWKKQTMPEGQGRNTCNNMSKRAMHALGFEPQAGNLRIKYQKNLGRSEGGEWYNPMGESYTMGGARETAFEVALGGWRRDKVGHIGLRG